MGFCTDTNPAWRCYKNNVKNGKTAIKPKIILPFCVFYKKRFIFVTNWVLCIIGHHPLRNAKDGFCISLVCTGLLYTIVCIGHFLNELFIYFNLISIHYVVI